MEANLKLRLIPLDTTLLIFIQNERIIVFKNREVSIRVHKAEPKDEDEPRNERVIFEDRVAIVHFVIKDLAQDIAFAVAGYILLDTFRKVMIAKNSH